MSERTADRLALGACLMALLLALALGVAHRIGSFNLETDFYNWYAPQVVGILRGEPYTFRHNPPGYILILTGATWLVGDPVHRGQGAHRLRRRGVRLGLLSPDAVALRCPVALGATVLLLLSWCSIRFAPVPTCSGRWRR